MFERFVRGGLRYFLDIFVLDRRLDLKHNLKIFHSGNVVLNDFVNIGSNCSIDRGSFSDTIIGINTYLDKDILTHYY